MILLVPAVLTVYLAFNAGGFLPAAPAIAVMALALVLVGRAKLVADALRGTSASFVIAAAALALFALWTFASAMWSHAPGRALLETDRVLLYLLVFLLCGSVARSASSLTWLVRGVIAATVIICLAAVLSRTLPDLYPVPLGHRTARLSHPLTYWNALGLMAAIGTVLCFHVTTTRRRSATERCLAAAALPLTATTLLLTFSRGAAVVTGVALLAYALLGRPSGLIDGLFAAAPTGVALVFAYDADSLPMRGQPTPSALVQGRHLALSVGLCMAAAALIHLLVARRAAPGLVPWLRRLAICAAVTLLTAAALTVVAPAAPQGSAQHSMARPPSAIAEGDTGAVRTRLTELQPSARIDLWGVAVDAFRARPLIGHGSGTYALLWSQLRPAHLGTSLDAHSLYLEVLAELGVVGLLVLGVALVVIFLTLFSRARHSREDGCVYAALLAAGLAWALHAGVDWDWEMPAVTVWFFAVGGAVLAPPDGGRRFKTPPKWRARVELSAVVLCALVAGGVAMQIALSQFHLNRAVVAFERGGCQEALRSARASVSALGSRAEPREIAGLCLAARGSHAASLRSLARAVERDPQNWRFHYSLAVTRAAAGLDPRPHLVVAERLNPHSRATGDAVERFGTDDPRAWRAEALTTPLPGPGPPTLATVLMRERGAR